MSHVFEVVSESTKRLNQLSHLTLMTNKIFTNCGSLYTTCSNLCVKKIAQQISSVRTFPRVGRKILLSMKMIFASLKIIFGALATKLRRACSRASLNLSIVSSFNVLSAASNRNFTTVNFYSFQIRRSPLSSSSI